MTIQKYLLEEQFQRPVDRDFIANWLRLAGLPE
jgi:hypothetical protein